MSAIKVPIVTGLARGAAGLTAAVNPFHVVSEVVAYLQTSEQEQTRREAIRAKRDVLVSALEMQRDVLLAYFAHRFAERRESLAEYYQLLHTAVASSNTAQIELALNSIVTILQDNPLKDLSTFEDIWRAGGVIEL
jgi:hypothetical protein